MSLKHVDIESALRRLADRRIEEAMREGKFDNLAGRGKPMDLEPMPADENARLAWWAIRLMKNADYTPDEVRLRKQIDTLKDELPKATTEAKVIAVVTAINATVRNLNTLGTNAINVPIAPVSPEVELRRFRERQAAGLIGDGSGGLFCRRSGCATRNATNATYCRRCGGKLVVNT